MLNVYIFVCIYWCSHMQMYYLHISKHKFITITYLMQLPD